MLSHINTAERNNNTSPYKASAWKGKRPTLGFRAESFLECDMFDLVECRDSVIGNLNAP